MCPSTEATEAQREFAADVLRNLLRRIHDEDENGRDPFLVSHAWTEGPMMYLVYKAPPSHITRGLARDTRQSIINPGPWLSQDDPALYYYLLDLEEGRVSASFRHPGNPDTILWDGFPLEGLPEQPSDIPEAYRYNAIDRSVISEARPRSRSVRYQRASPVWKSAMSNLVNSSSDSEMTRTSFVDHQYLSD